MPALSRTADATRKTVALLAACLLLAAAAPSPTPSPSVMLGSAFPSVKAARLSDLPSAPTSTYQDPDCLKQSSRPPKTPGGRLAAQRGWHVFGERTVAGITAVVIASGVGAGTSGMCLVENGNIALFRGARLIGVFYPAERKGSVASGFGPRLGDRLRVKNASSIDADLVFAKHRVSFARPGPERRICGMDAIVPAILDTAMSVARPRLLSTGWKPIAHAEEAESVSPVANRLWKEGWKEVEPCAGSGLGYCRFRYRRKKVELLVTTIGERPVVSDYRIVCPDRR